MSDGSHSFTAKATDAAGKPARLNRRSSVTVDTAAPAAPAITSFSTDSGVAGDGLTNDNTLTLTGTAEANSTVKVYDGATLLGTATTNGSGAWSFTTALADGTHSFTAKATDAAGNVSAASALSVTVDTAAHCAYDRSFSSDSGVVGDGITNDKTLALTGTAEANSTVKVYDGADALGTATANGSGAWSYTTRDPRPTAATASRRGRPMRRAILACPRPPGGHHRYGGADGADHRLVLDRQRRGRVMA